MKRRKKNGREGEEEIKNILLISWRSEAIFQFCRYVQSKIVGLLVLDNGFDIVEYQYMKNVLFLYWIANRQYHLKTNILDLIDTIESGT